jgi:restriction system protein
MNEYEGIGELSPSKQTAAKTIYAALTILKEAGGEMPGKEVMEKIPEKVNLTDWEKERYEKSGYIRWQSVLHFFTIDCSKAGFLIKQNGVWYLTDEGEEALDLGAVKLLEAATAKYRAWDRERSNETTPDISDEIEAADEGDSEQLIKANLEQLEDNAIDGIKGHVRGLNPYEFQDLVAALLRAMGYFTPYVSPRGRDGGIDIIAYQDPLGANAPRIKTQVKHRPDAAIPVDDIRSLTSLLNQEGDIGLFVTSGRFTSEADRFARDYNKHVKLIDIDTFIPLWIDFYNKADDEDKKKLSLQPIYYLGTTD